MHAHNHHLREEFSCLTESSGVLAPLTAGLRLLELCRQTSTPAWTKRLLMNDLNRSDLLTRCFLIAGLGIVGDSETDQTIADFLQDEDPIVRGHAAWALSERPYLAGCVEPLIALTLEGGFSAMLGQLALESWMAQEPELVATALSRRLRHLEDPLQRLLLGEVLATSRHDTPSRLLLDMCCDPGEAPGLRASLTFSLSPDAAQQAVGRLGGELSSGLRKATRELNRVALGRNLADFSKKRNGGLRIAQLLVQGRIDSALNGAGIGDTGGLATVMIGLTRSLSRHPEIDHVFTIGRVAGTPDPTCPRRWEQMGEKAAILDLQLYPDQDLRPGQLWRYRLQIEQRLSTLFRMMGPLDGVHLRFTDVGTFAASRLCRRLGIPVFFTMAPDPHSAIEADERSGRLSRTNFSKAEAESRLIFRMRLIEKLSEQSSRLALFPRPHLAGDLRRLMGFELDAVASDKVRVVAEGIDFSGVERACQAVRRSETPMPALSKLTRILESRLPSRRGLPLLVTLGRLHPIKGTSRLVEAWARDPNLVSAFNLVIIGGTLEDPTDTEREVLNKIQDIVEENPESRSGLILLGHVPNFEALCLLQAAHHGRGRLVGAGGFFVCPSDKEEFGIALLEALASGLPVVAPNSGGPPSYIRDGVDGVLVDTTSVTEIRSGIYRLSDLNLRPDSTRIKRLFSIDSMSRELVELYRLEYRNRVGA